MTATTTQHHTLAAARLAAWLGGTGLVDRSERIAARRNFVHVKRCFMAAVEQVHGRRGQWLRHQVRQANEPVELWLLRGAVFDAVSARGPLAGHELPLELQRALDGVMPGGDEDDALLMAS